MFVEVVRSPRRRKTIELRPAAGGQSLRLVTPSKIPAAEEREHLAALLVRWRRKRTKPPVDLNDRAKQLATEYGLPRPNRIEWVNNQTTRWGSCTRSTAHIRLSTMLSTYPVWVIDYVIVHEMAHLWFAGHPDAFWQIVNRYPLAERARGYLMAKGTDEPAI